MGSKKEPQLVFHGTASNGRFIPDKPNWWDINLQNHRRICVIVEDEKPDKSTPQLGYYFGVLIGIVCMRHESFGGWTKNDIDIHLRKTLRGYKKVYTIKGQERIEECFDDISRYNIDQMSQYISEVIYYLTENLRDENDNPIEIPDSHDYKLNKYVG